MSTKAELKEFYEKSMKLSHDKQEAACNNADALIKACCGGYAAADDGSYGAASEEDLITRFIHQVDETPSTFHTSKSRGNMYALHLSGYYQLEAPKSILGLMQAIKVWEALVVASKGATFGRQFNCHPLGDGGAFPIVLAPGTFFDEEAWELVEAARERVKGVKCNITTIWCGGETSTAPFRVVGKVVFL